MKLYFQELSFTTSDMQLLHFVSIGEIPLNLNM